MRLRDVVLVLAVSACFEEPSYEDLRCAPDRPCPSKYLCRNERCLRACVTDSECGGGEVCRSGACTPIASDAGPNEPEDGGTIGEDGGLTDGGLSPNDCAACDLPAAVCIENDRVYRAYVNLGACAKDPSACSYAVFDVECPGCTASCLDPCSALSCDDLGEGCRIAGYCVPSVAGASCAYVSKTDSSTCTTSAGESGFCLDGDCVTCIEGEPCDDGDLCTYDDRCSNGTCIGTPIACVSDDCMERTCDGTATCVETPRMMNTPCTDDGRACTRDVCDGAGTCQHLVLPDGTQCGAVEALRCCNTECVDISTDERHCGGCGTACDPGFACEPIESTPSCGASYPARVSGRCLCQGANSQCPNNRGQVCRLTQYLDGNRCVPDSSTPMPCAAGQRVEVIDNCPGYCAY